MSDNIEDKIIINDASTKRSSYQCGSFKGQFGVYAYLRVYSKDMHRLTYIYDVVSLVFTIARHKSLTHKIERTGTVYTSTIYIHHIAEPKEVIEEKLLILDTLLLLHNIK